MAMESQSLIYFPKSVPGCIPVRVLGNYQSSSIDKLKALATPITYMCTCVHRYKVLFNRPKPQQRPNEFIRADRYCGAPD
jgi:hypothetical protein